MCRLVTDVRTSIIKSEEDYTLNIPLLSGEEKLEVPPKKVSVMSQKSKNAKDGHLDIIEF